MTQEQFNTDFKATYPHFEVMTLTDRRLYYNDMMENYRRDGLITEKQANSWAHPKFLTANTHLIDCKAY